MKFGVVVFPGSNCDDDLVYVMHEVLNCEVVKLWHKDTDLQGCEAILIPGGFSYGDYLRSGAIARFSPIMEPVINHANNGGIVIGICNGFQVLTEAHLLPGTLLHNKDRKFICRNAGLKPISRSAPITAHLNFNKTYNIPVAHAEGSYYIDDKKLSELKTHDQILFKYTDEHGRATDEANFNGSVENIAGVSNKEKNVMGIMPHPERAADEMLNNTDGKEIFESLLKSLVTA